MSLSLGERFFRIQCDLNILQRSLTDSYLSFSEIRRLVEERRDACLSESSLDLLPLDDHLQISINNLRCRILLSSQNLQANYRNNPEEVIARAEKECADLEIDMRTQLKYCLNCYWNSFPKESKSDPYFEFENAIDKYFAHLDEDKRENLVLRILHEDFPDKSST